MSHRRKKFLSVGLAGVLCSTALFGLPAAPAAGNDGRGGKNNLHLPGLRDRQQTPDNSFARMFPDLPPFAPPTDEAREQAKKLGAKGGIIDAKDDLSDPILSITDPQRSLNNRDNPTMTAGVTFFGQFLDHDITLDPRSPLLEKANPGKTTNFRTAAFDLDSVYGSGPADSPELYDVSSGDIKLRVEPIPGSEAASRNGAIRYDLPRDPNNNTAILGDSRNDEHVILAQFHLAMLRFHNAVTDQLRADPANAGQSAERIFKLAQRQVRWHYQWIILHEFLPLTIGQERVDDILKKGLRFYEVNKRAPLIPIEFAVSAYRFGHSQIRPSYRLNFGPTVTPAAPFFVFLFDDTQDPNSTDPNDLRGGKRAPRRFVDWQTFFDFGDGNFRNNKQIDGVLSSVVMLLPGSRGVAAPGLPADGVTSLASRNLMRHVNFGIPSGQAIARRMRVPVLTPTQLEALAPFEMEKSTPLWYYILKEAEIMENGLRLGPVGSRIVGEVFIGLLKADESSYLAAQPRWTPVLPSATPGDFRITDLLKFAGVVPPLN